jgi:hypothetical protein
MTFHGLATGAWLMTCSMTNERLRLRRPAGNQRPGPRSWPYQPDARVFKSRFLDFAPKGAPASLSPWLRTASGAARRRGETVPWSANLRHSQSRSGDVSHSAISPCHEQPIPRLRTTSGAKRRRGGMVPWSASLCHDRSTTKKPENRARSRDRQRPVRGRAQRDAQADGKVSRDNGQAQSITRCGGKIGTEPRKNREHGGACADTMEGQTGAVIFYGPVLLTVGSSGRSDHGCANAGSDTHVRWKPRRPG